MRSSSILFLTERALNVQTVSGVLGKFLAVHGMKGRGGGNRGSGNDWSSLFAFGVRLADVCREAIRCRSSRSLVARAHVALSFFGALPFSMLEVETGWLWKHPLPAIGGTRPERSIGQGVCCVHGDGDGFAFSRVKDLAEKLDSCTL